MSTMVPLLNSSTLDGWNIYSGQKIHETPRKYNMPPDTNNNVRGDPKARWEDDVENDTRKTELLIGEKQCSIGRHGGE